jgi:hypothetical protein
MKKDSLQTCCSPKDNDDTIWTPYCSMCQFILLLTGMFELANQSVRLFFYLNWHTDLESTMQIYLVLTPLLSVSWLVSWLQMLACVPFIVCWLRLVMLDFRCSFFY